MRSNKGGDEPDVFRFAGLRRSERRVGEFEIVYKAPNDGP